MGANRALWLHRRRGWLWPRRASQHRSERKCLWHGPDRWHLRRRHYLQTSSTRRKLGFQVIHTFTGGDYGATGSAGRMLLQPRPAVWCGYGARHVWERSCFRAHTDSSWGIEFQGAIFFFTANPTGVSRMAGCSALLRVRSTAPLITAVKMVSALFTNCLPGPLGNGKGE